VVGLLAAAALTVHRGRADVFGQTSHQPGNPADVVGLRGELGHAPADDLLDLTGVDAGLLHDSLLDRTEEFGRM
jgi:hypothetical protein